MTSDSELLLVSGSPRRRELLDMIGVSYRVLNADIDETPLPGEDPEGYVQRLALAKAKAGLEINGTGLPALGADTIVLLQGRILGKPESRAAASEMLRSLSGQMHEVLTAVAVIATSGKENLVLNRTRVSFGDIPTAWIEEYVQHDEPMDKAGAYAIQGLCGQWVRRIEGSYSGVMGLPVFETAGLLREVGVL
jgi:septum formation protein